MDQWLFLLHRNFYDLDHNAQELAYRAYRKLVYRDIYFLFRKHELAEDVVQESFLKVVAKAPKLKSSKHLKAWIIKVARNLAYDFLKKYKKYYPVSEPQAVIDIKTSILQPTVDEQVEVRVRNELLHEALNKLNPLYRLALSMHYIEEKPYKQIAQELGKTEQALAQTMARARKQLFCYFPKNWVDADE